MASIDLAQFSDTRHLNVDLTLAGITLTLQTRTGFQDESSRDPEVGTDEGMIISSVAVDLLMVRSNPIFIASKIRHQLPPSIGLNVGAENNKRMDQKCSLKRNTCILFSGLGNWVIFFTCNIILN